MDAENEYKVRSIRARESTLDEFTELAKSFDNQAELLDTLIEFYKSKQLSVGRETEVANFEAHLKTILESYAHALTLANDAELRASSHYAEQLASKDNVISDLQQKNKILDTQVSRLEEDKGKLIDRVVEMENTISNFARKEKQFNAQLEDKEKLIAGLEEKVTASNATVMTLMQDAEAQKAALSELGVVKDECGQLKSELVNSKKQQEEAAHEYQHQIEELTRKHENEITTTQNEYENKIAKMKNEHQSALLQAEVRQEKALLEMQRSTYLESKRYLEEINALNEEIMQLKLSIAAAEIPNEQV